jgi:hypothetical protein
MSETRDSSRSQVVEPDPWPHEPPAELLEALDHAAARLSELDASLLLQLVCGSKLRVPRISAV